MRFPQGWNHTSSQEPPLSPEPQGRNHTSGRNPGQESRLRPYPQYLNHNLQSVRAGYFSFSGLQTLDALLTLAPHFRQTKSGLDLSWYSFFSQAFLLITLQVFQFPVGKNNVNGEIVFQVGGHFFGGIHRAVLTARTAEVDGQVGEAPVDVFLDRLVDQ